jgi:hypothetical protein
LPSNGLTTGAVASLPADTHSPPISIFAAIGLARSVEPRRPQDGGAARASPIVRGRV